MATSTSSPTINLPMSVLLDVCLASLRPADDANNPGQADADNNVKARERDDGVDEFHDGHDFLTAIPVHQGQKGPA